MKYIKYQVQYISADNMAGLGASFQKEYYRRASAVKDYNGFKKRVNSKGKNENGILILSGVDDWGASDVLRIKGGLGDV